MSDNLSLPQGNPRTQPQTAHDAPERKPQSSPFSTERGKALLGNSNKQRLTDSTPEIENVIISTIAWAGREDRWTWALFRTTHIGRELYAEIPQEPTEGYEVDQEVLKGIFHLYPEIKYITAHPQMMAFWPGIECKFKRIPKPHGKGTRLALVSFKQRDVYREDEISREEQLQKLMGKTTMDKEQQLEDISISAQAEAEQEAAAWAELGKRDDTPISEAPKPLLGRVHFEKDFYLVSGHIAKWLKLTDKEAIGKATREAMGGKTWPEMWPKEDDEHPVSREQWQEAADRVARMADEYVTRKLNAPSFEVTLATARNTAMVTFGNYNVDASAGNFKAATGYDNALQYMSQPGATVDALKKAIADWCLVHNAAAQNETAKNVTQAASSATPDDQPQRPVETAKENVISVSSVEKLPPVQAKPNGAKPMDVDTKDQIRNKHTKQVSGRDYLQVTGRVLLFRFDHPNWTIETDSVTLTDTSAVFKCIIRDDAGRIISTGHGRATEAGTKTLGGRFIEKAETAAIGRALALAGFGTDDTLDDVEYLADSPIAA